MGNQNGIIVESGIVNSENKYNVTLEQYREIANKVYEKEITWEEYEKYNIVLGVKTNHKNSFINGIVDGYCVDYHNNNSKHLFTGSFRGNYHFEMLENNFKYMSEWSNGYRDVYVSENDMAIITFCEGDLSVSLHETIKSYQNEINECKEFYKEY